MKLYDFPLSHLEARRTAIERAVLADRRGDATIADMALYSYVARAPEGDVDLSPYPHTIAWLKQVEALPGLIAFPETARDVAVA
jgi:glutathione S-transferase